MPSAGGSAGMTDTGTWVEVLGSLLLNVAVFWGKGPGARGLPLGIS